MEQNTNPKEAKHFTDEDFYTILKSTSSGFTNSQEIKKIEGLNEKVMTKEQIHHILYPNDLDNKYSQKRFDDLQEKAKGTDKKIKMEYNLDRQLAVFTVMNVSGEDMRQWIKDASMNEKKAATQTQENNLGKSKAATGVSKVAETVQKNLGNAARGLEID